MLANVASICALITIFLSYHTCLAGQHLVRDSINAPCSFFDSVNITDGAVKLPNGSYEHQGIIYPKELVGIYNYVFDNITHRSQAEPHLRGCICKLKTCLRSCCANKSSVYAVSNKTCIDYPSHIDSDVLIKKKDGTYAVVDVFQNYGWVSGRPCYFSLQLEPDRYGYDHWQLLENGTVILFDNMEYLSKNEYCITPYTPLNATGFNLSVLRCYNDNVVKTKDVIYSYSMFFSIPFMIITILVYTIIPELRNLHGMSLSCYLGGLVIGYSILGYFLITGSLDIPAALCTALGFICYFCFMSSFFWLSVISFDLWWNFRGTQGINRLKEKKRFFLYCLYAWGLSVIFLAITLGVQVSDIPELYKPGIGTYHCWLDMDKTIQVAYFFGPIIIVIIFNITMFTLTSLKIHRVQREMARIMARQDSQRNLHGEKDKFGLFLRLFIVMGVTWSLECVAWILEVNDLWSKIFYLTDICNAIQGFIIFALFVLKKKVKVLIVKRYRSFRGVQDRTSQYSSKTTSSNVTMAPISCTPGEKPLMMQTIKEQT